MCRGSFGFSNSCCVECGTTCTFSGDVAINALPHPGVVFEVFSSCIPNSLLRQGIDFVLRPFRRFGFKKAFLSLSQEYIEEGDNGVKMNMNVVKKV